MVIESGIITAINTYLFVFPENALLSQPDLARSIRGMPDRRLLEGYRLVGKIEGIRVKLLMGQHNCCKIGLMTPVRQEEKIARYSNLLRSLFLVPKTLSFYVTRCDNIEK